LPVIYSLSIFSLGCIKTPWGDATRFGTVLAHLSYRWNIWFLFLEPEVTRFRLTADRRKFGKIRGFPRQLFRGGVKSFAGTFQAWPHIGLVCKFRGDPLRDGCDPLSRNIKPKPSTLQPLRLGEKKRRRRKTEERKKKETTWRKYNGLPYIP